MMDMGQSTKFWRQMLTWGNSTKDRSDVSILMVMDIQTMVIPSPIIQLNTRPDGDGYETTSQVMPPKLMLSRVMELNGMIRRRTRRQQIRNQGDHFPNNANLARFDEDGYVKTMLSITMQHSGMIQMESMETIQMETMQMLSIFFRMERFRWRWCRRYRTNSNLMVVNLLITIIWQEIIQMEPMYQFKRFITLVRC